MPTVLRIPGIGRRWKSTLAVNQDLRVTTVSRRFQDYLIFSRPIDEGVEIVRVLHGARDVIADIDSIWMMNEIEVSNGTSVVSLSQTSLPWSL
jgi:hypothetical protein